MLRIFNVHREIDSVEVCVDHEGMHILVTRTYSNGEIQFCQWNVQEYPEAFVASAEQSLKGYQGFHTCFMFPVGESFIDGRFAARPDDEWVEFFFTMDSKAVHMFHRKTEVKKLVSLIKQYWNQSED